MASQKTKSSWGQKEIVIKIIGTTEKVAKKTKAKDDEEFSSKILNFLSHPLKKTEKFIFDNEKTGKHLIAQYIFDNAISNAKKTATFSYNKYLNLSENYLLENDLEGIKSGLGFANGLGASIISGAKLGSAGGPYGAIIGAIAGVSVYGVAQGISYEQKKYGYYNSIAASTYQSEYSQIRAGLIDGGRNTRE